MPRKKRETSDVEVVRIEHVTKHFVLRKQKSLKESIVNAGRARTFREEFTALDDVNLTIHAGESIGLVGPNGSGKSTLLKVIGGILAPNEGSVQVRGRVAALLELGAGFHPDLTGRENVYLNASILGLSHEETEQYFDAIVEFSGIKDFIDTQVKFYSSGMYVRLAFAVAVHVDPDILLVDEVLAVGDEPFQQKCMDKIRQFQDEGRTIILVSHSSGQVADVCDRAIVLEHGRVIEDSTPLIALGRLRKDYQVVMDEDATAKTDRSRLKATIDRVYLTDSLDSPHHSDYQVVMPPGSDLEVHCEVVFEQSTTDWSVEVEVESTLGGVVAGYDSREEHTDLPEADGLVAFECVLPGLNLNYGEYLVNVIVRDSDGAQMAKLPRASIFAVRTKDEYHSVGPVFTRGRIDFEEPTTERQ